MQTPLRVFLEFGDLLFGQRMISRLKLLESAQWWEPEKIDEHRIIQLKKLINVVHNDIPFYREIIDSAGINPEAITTLIDLNKLPVITKNVLRNGYPEKVTRATGQKTYEASTSGSTGQNFLVKEDAFTAGWYRASFLLALEWAGWTIGNGHLQTGMTLHRSFDRRLKDWFLNCQYISAYELDDSHLEQMLSVIEEKKISFIFGYPGSLFFLARYARKQGWNKPLVSAVTWGDMLYPSYRTEIESVFQTNVFDTYGCAEGFQISAQCTEGNYHIHALDVIVEFLDDSGQQVKSGETGNITVTRLHPGPMPFIRYATGDLGIPAGSEMCACGRGFPLMRSIQGRNADVVTTPSGNRLIVHFFTGVLEHFHVINRFQVVQENQDSLLIHVVPTEPLSALMEHQIIKALKDRGCTDMKIRIECVDQIPLTAAGKNRFIISKISE